MIYLDHNATSPLLPEVRAAMEPWWGRPANPSSVHRAGQQAASAVEEATEHVARLVGKAPRQVVFTSGATEANALWIHGCGSPPHRIAVGATEHPSVHLAVPGGVVLPVGPDGRHLPPPEGVEGVSVMAANHETGVVTDLASFLGRPGWLHVDATAAAGRMPLDLRDAAAVTLSAHKIGGPLGVGALVVDNDDLPALFPGSQQRGRRGGTLNTPGVVGFGEAARLALLHLEARRAHWLTLQARLESLVRGLGGQVVGRHRLPTVVNVVFPGLPAEAVVQALDLQGICVSAGSACASGSVAASPVLEAMGHPEPRGGVRFRWGWSSQEADVVAVETRLPSVLEAARLFL